MISRSFLNSSRTQFRRKLYSTSSSNTQLSTLPNGIRVATEPTPGHFIGAGVYIDAGSRYESAKLRGSTHFTDRMAFKSTANRTSEQISLEIEELGGSFFASSGRDTIVYQSTSYPKSLDSVLSILSDTTLTPSILDSELEIEKSAVEWEVNELQKKPEFMIPELLHEVAYPNNTLGLPLICPLDRIHKIDSRTLFEYRSMFFRPERIVVAGVGVEHSEFLELAFKHFGSFESPATSQPSTVPTNHLSSVSPSSLQTKPILSKTYATTTNQALSPIDPLTGQPLQTFQQLVSAKPYYKGGEMRIPDHGKPRFGENTPLAHIYIGFEAPSIHDQDLYAIACAHIMLGGGSSFSAGGPGKGMYSRLYTRVLNLNPEVEFCQAFHHAYQDSGLFGIGMSVLPKLLNKVPHIIAQQLHQISGNHRQGDGISELELRRAKNQLRSTMMFGLESRVLQVEDLGRQVQCLGRKRPWSEIWESIEALTVEDIHRVISRIIRPASSGNVEAGLSGEPTIIATGQIDGLGDVKEVLSRYGIGSVQSRSKGWW